MEKKITSNNTTISDDGNGMTQVILHSTPIVKWDEKKIILNSGGWETYTTKSRMNEVGSAFNLKYSVYQEKGVWFVVKDIDNGRDWDNPILFIDGMELAR